MEKKQSYVTRIQTVFYSLHKSRKHLRRLYKKMLKQDSILQTINQKDHFINEKIIRLKKVIGLIKDESNGEMTTIFAALRAKTSSF